MFQSLPIDFISFIGIAVNAIDNSPILDEEITIIPRCSACSKIEVQRLLSRTVILCAVLANPWENALRRRRAYEHLYAFMHCSPFHWLELLKSGGHFLQHGRLFLQFRHISMDSMRSMMAHKITLKICKSSFVCHCLETVPSEDLCSWRIS